MRMRVGEGNGKKEKKDNKKKKKYVGELNIVREIRKSLFTIYL